MSESPGTASEPDDPLPLAADASLVVSDGGRVLIGGSPLTVLRFARPVELSKLRSLEVIDRLIDVGMVHPMPTTASIGAEDVSVVIPCLDHPVALAATLDGLAATTPGVARVIVVDDGSADADALAATARADRGLPVTVIRNAHNAGPAAARNAGLAEVDTPMVVFLDAGCVPEQGWLAPLLAHLSDPKVALVAPRVVADGSRMSEYSSHRGRLRGRVASAISFYEQSRSPLDLGPQAGRVAPRTRVAYVPSACVIGRVNVLRKVGGFDESMRVGEDVDLVWRLGETHRVRYEPRARVTHDVRTDPVAWVRRRFDYGTSAAPLSRRHPDGPVPVRVSPWSAAAWGVTAIGHPLIGSTVAATSVVLLARKLSGLEQRTRLAASLAGRGNLAAGGLLATAIRRAWWPLGLAAACAGPRPLRRTMGVVFIVAPLVEWRPSMGMDPLLWLALRLADDGAYGAGVWAGCAHEGTIRPLLPDFSAGRFSRHRSTR